MAYTIDEVIEQLNKRVNNVYRFYKEDKKNVGNGSVATNWIGATLEGEKYSKIVVEYVKETNLLDKVEPIVRENLYNVDTDKHSKYRNDPISTGSYKNIEKRIQYTLFKSCKNVFDIEVPLKNVSSDDAGAIDLLFEYDDYLYICELKKPDSKEYLKAVYEIEIYSRILGVNKDSKSKDEVTEKLFQQYKDKINKELNDDIKKSIMISEKEYVALKEHEELFDFMVNECEIKIFTYPDNILEVLEKHLKNLNDNNTLIDTLNFDDYGIKLVN